MPRPPRDADLYRSYTTEHVATLRLAAGLRHLGVELHEVAPVIEVAHDGECRDIRSYLMATLQTLLPQIEAKVEDLQHTRDRVAAVFSGLEAMQPPDATVPSVETWRCVEPVAEGG